MGVLTDHHVLADIVQRHRELYEGPAIDAKLDALVRDGSHTNLTSWDVLRLLRESRSVFFETHVEVVSGHHTATYLRFESLARYPESLSLIARDMADWIRRAFQHAPLTGVLATASAASSLAQAIAEELRETMPIRVTLTPYSFETGRIGTDITSGSVAPGERFLALNDVTTRGNCVSKLGKVITDHGGLLSGMMVFARRDSGQFPLMADLTTQYPFYYTTDLDMPQWEPSECPLCGVNKPVLSWKDLPAL
jgi:orotate phosphoribosyltransferase